MSDTAEAVKHHIRSYVIIGVSLILLTIVTVVVAKFHFGQEGDNFWNITVALVIAAIKAGLVATIFMHLFWDMFVKMAVIFKVMIFTAVFFVGLMALTLWTLRDAIGHSKYHVPMFRYDHSAPAAKEHGKGH